MESIYIRRISDSTILLEFSSPPMIDDEKIIEIIDEPSPNLAFRSFLNRRNVGKFDNDVPAGFFRQRLFY